jgi:hypothetical protein
VTGKRYYMTTLGDWQRHAARFANSHFIVLDSQAPNHSVGAQHAVPDAARPEFGNVLDSAVERAASDDGDHESPATDNHGGLAADCQASAPGTACCAPTVDKTLPDADAQILVLIEADEGVHLALEDDAAFEALPHPLAQKPISEGAQAALAEHGVTPGATTFEVAEAVARFHPLLRHRVF